MQYPLEQDKNYVIKAKEQPRDVERFARAVRNALKMNAKGHLVTLVWDPDKILSEMELAAYKKILCKRAKEEGRNFVYFEVPIEVIEEDPLVGTMFEGSEE